MKVTQKTAAINEFLATDEPEPEVNETQEVEEEEFLDPLDAMAKQFPDAPPRRMVEGWKELYGDVYAFVPDPNTLFLLRPLRRIEHKNIAKEIRIFAEGPTGRDDPAQVEEMMHEKVVGLCLLYPGASPNFLTMSKAGLMPTLFNLVMEHSKFLSQQRALEVCYKL